MTAGPIPIPSNADGAVVYHEPSPETRARHVAGAIIEMRQRYPDLSWEDAQMINHGPGWDYELRWYEQSPLRGPGAPILVRGERLDDLSLIRAWQLARERTYQSASRGARHCRRCYPRGARDRPAHHS